MWNRFTERARRVVEDAKGAAADRGVFEVSDLHLFDAILRNHESLAWYALRQSSVDVETLLDKVRESLPRDGCTTPTDFRLGNSAKRAIELAAEEADRMGQAWIGTEHLLLGLLRGEGEAGHVLGGVGFGLTEWRERVRKIPGQGTDRGGPT